VVVISTAAGQFFDWIKASVALAAKVSEGMVRKKLGKVESEVDVAPPSQRGRERLEAVVRATWVSFDQRGPKTTT
jgi:hypothetical protein